MTLSIADVATINHSAPFVDTLRTFPWLRKPWFPARVSGHPQPHREAVGPLDHRLAEAVDPYSWEGSNFSERRPGR